MKINSLKVYDRIYAKYDKYTLKRIDRALKLYAKYSDKQKKFSLYDRFKMMYYAKKSGKYEKMLEELNS